MNDNGHFFTHNSSEELLCIPDFYWDSPILSKQQQEQIIDNLNSIYSPYVIRIVRKNVDQSNFHQYILALINIAGFRDFYGEDWIGTTIPTSSIAKEMFSEKKMAMAGKLQQLFDVEKIYQQIDSLWQDATGILPKGFLRYTLCSDYLQYGFDFIRHAIQICKGENIKSDPSKQIETYDSYLEAAIHQNWEATEKIAEMAGCPASVTWGVPHRQTDLHSKVNDYFEIKFGRALTEVEQKKMQFIINTSNPRDTIFSLSKVSNLGFNFEHFILQHFSIHNDYHFINYLLQFENLATCERCGNDLLYFSNRSEYNKKGACNRIKEKSQSIFKNGNLIAENSEAFQEWLYDDSDSYEAWLYNNTPFLYCPFCNNEYDYTEILYNWHKVEEKYNIKMDLEAVKEWIFNEYP